MGVLEERRGGLMGCGSIVLAPEPAGMGISRCGAAASLSYLQPSIWFPCDRGVVTQEEHWRKEGSPI